MKIFSTVFLASSSLAREREALTCDISKLFDYGIGTITRYKFKCNSKVCRS